MSDTTFDTRLIMELKLDGDTFQAIDNSPYDR